VTSAIGTAGAVREEQKIVERSGLDGVTEGRAQARSAPEVVFEPEEEQERYEGNRREGGYGTVLVREDKLDRGTAAEEERHPLDCGRQACPLELGGGEVLIQDNAALGQVPGATVRINMSVGRVGQGTIGPCRARAALRRQSTADRTRDAKPHPEEEER